MKAKHFIPLIGISLIWGSYYVASQQAVKQMSVFNTGIMIRLVTFIFLLIVMAGKKQLHELTHVKGVLCRLILIGILGFLLDLTAFIGLTISRAGTGTALLKCDIIFVNLISAIIYKKRFTKYEWIFTGIMLFGVFLVVGVDFSNFSFDLGSIFFILSALFVSINAFVIKSVQLDKNNPQPDNNIAFYNNIVTMISFMITTTIRSTWGQFSLLLQSPSLVTAVFLAGLGQTGIYLVYYYDLRHFPVWLVKTFLLCMPIVASLISFVLFGERLTGEEILGIIIVLGGGFGMLVSEGQRLNSGEILQGR